MPDRPKPASLPLAILLGHTADAVEAVRGGTSLTEALGRCPTEARPGTQALAFHALRWLGSAEVVRRALAPKQPPPTVDALLLTVLALLWPAGTPPYADHVIVDQAVSAAKRRAPASAAFVNAVLRRFLREREASGRRRAGESAGALEPSGLVDDPAAPRLAEIGGRRSPPPTTPTRR